MNVNDMFPSKYLKAASLQGQEVEVIIDTVRMETIKEDGGDKDIPVVTFSNTDKMLTLNKTNAESIAQHYGPDTDAWSGKKIVLYPTKTSFKGTPTDCIRVRVPLPQATPESAPF